MLELIKNTLEIISEKGLLFNSEIERAREIYKEGSHVILSQGKEKITVLIEHGEGYEIQIVLNGEDQLSPKTDGKLTDWDSKGLAALYIIEDELKDETLAEGIKYTREGMIKRVMEERQEKAKKAEYKVQLAQNLYGEHTLTNEKGKAYKITLRDF